MDIKISEMTYSQLAAGDAIPTVNIASPTTNNYALGGDIPLLMGISKWDASAVYTSGHIVIYDSATTKGLFMVNTTTTAGDAPEGIAGYDKFNAIALNWVQNALPVTFSLGAGTIDITGKRTGTITTSALSILQTYTITIVGDFTVAGFEKKITLKQLASQTVSQNVYENNIENFTISVSSTNIITIIFRATKNYPSGIKIDFKMEG
jgi:hypothetical protein